MNNTDVENIIKAIQDNKNSNSPIMIVQCITLTIVVLKPIFMYWIQAKYKADPPHESIRSFEGADTTTNS